MKNITFYDDYCHPAERPKTALVVDDDPLMCELVEAILCSRGFQVSVAGDGQQALALASDPRAESFDLLFTDICMPGMNGVELEKEVRKVQPGIKVIFSSGHSAADLGKMDCDVFGHTFVRKPFSLQAIDVAMDTITEGELVAA